MTVKLELYKIYKQVCDDGSISEAAKSLYISQSAVSQAIKQLESQVGVSLLRRTPKGVIQTQEGKLLYEYASSAIDLLSVAEQKLEAMKTLNYGELKIAASDTISHYLLLPVLEKFSLQYPKIKLQIINRTSFEAVNLLKSGKVDLAFINMPVYDEEILVSPYYTVEDIFVASKNSIYLNKTYSLEELAELPLILLEKKSNSRCYVEEFFNKKGIKISPEIELGSHDLLLEFAKINLGVSCVTKEFSTHYLNNKELMQIKIKESIPKRNIGVASLKGVSVTAAGQKFLELL